MNTIHAIPKLATYYDFFKGYWPQYGNRFHYHHFMFGYILPIIQKENIFENQIYVESCYKLNKISSELKFKIRLGDDTECGEKVFHEGFDCIKSYKEIKINLIIKKIFKLLDIEAEQKKEEEILIIDRKKNERRSIPNFYKFCNSLSKLTKIKKIFPEEMSLKNQIIEFKKHKKIILQHGAAMTNLIFCEPNTEVFEITSDPKCWLLYDMLCDDVKIKKQKIKQNDDHSKININNLLRIVLKNKTFV